RLDDTLTVELEALEFDRGLSCIRDEHLERRAGGDDELGGLEAAAGGAKREAVFGGRLAAAAGQTNRDDREEQSVSSKGPHSPLQLKLRMIFNIKSARAGQAETARAQYD